jgi:hypothetical protein
MNAEAIFTEATTAAQEAVRLEVAREPEDMNAFDCGFAWVTVKPARGPFVSWCKKQAQAQKTAPALSLPFDYGDNAYGGGWQFWKPGYFQGQSIRIHEVGARAFAQVLVQHGIEAHVGMRLD